MSDFFMSKSPALSLSERDSSSAGYGTAIHGHNPSNREVLMQKQIEIYELLKEVSELKDENKMLMQEKQQLRTLKDVLAGIPIEILRPDGKIPSREDKNVVVTSIRNTLRLLSNGLEDLYAKKLGFTFIMPLYCEKNSSFHKEEDVNSEAKSIYLQLSRRGLQWFHKAGLEYPNIEQAQEIQDCISTRRPLVTGIESYDPSDPFFSLLPDHTLLLPIVIDSVVVAITGFPRSDVPTHLLHNIQEELQKVWISLVIKGDNFIQDIQQRENLAKALELRNRRQNRISRELRELINKDTDPKKSFKATMTNFINYISLQFGGQTAGLIGVLDVEYNHAIFRKDVLEEIFDEEDGETIATAESSIGSTDSLKVQATAKKFIDLMYSDVTLGWATEEMSSLKAPRLKKMPFVKKFLQSENNAEVFSSTDAMKLPKGHVPLSNMAMFRVVYQNETVAVILLANYPEDDDVIDTCRILSQAVSGSWSDILNESLRKFEQQERYETAFDMLQYPDVICQQLKSGKKSFDWNLENASVALLMVEDYDAHFEDEREKYSHDVNLLFAQYDCVIRSFNLCKINESFHCLSFTTNFSDERNPHLLTKDIIMATSILFTLTEKFNRSHEKKSSDDIKIRVGVATGDLMSSIRTYTKKPTWKLGGSSFWQAQRLMEYSELDSLLVDIGDSYKGLSQLFQNPLQVITKNHRNVVKIERTQLLKPDFNFEVMNEYVEKKDAISEMINQLEIINQLNNEAKQ